MKQRRPACPLGRLQRWQPTAPAQLQPEPEELSEAGVPAVVAEFVGLHIVYRYKLPVLRSRTRPRGPSRTFELIALSGEAAGFEKRRGVVPSLPPLSRRPTKPHRP